MKKTQGWIIIFVTSFLLLIFLIALVAIGESFIKNPERQIDFVGLIKPTIAFLIIISVSIVGLKIGIKTVKREKIRNIKEYSNSLNIHLKGKIELRNYRNLIFQNSIQKPHAFIYIGIFIIVLMSAFNHTEGASNVTVLLPIILLSVFLSIPYIIYLQAKKQYYSNKIFQEILEYHLTNESLKIKGETVDSIQKWNHFFKLKDAKDFFVFYSGQNVATLIDKKMFNTENLNEFNKFIESLNIKIEK